ncbi:unnamed protein product [Prorocentrum cordatum]|uniref:Uncharacterized protein n=1 Tax=Prorocentrum cordatum TaxID=2364126 RepID=A0ABN9W2T8_9DINO|nr:unnamed protein product [Polarella glacialis]
MPPSSKAVLAVSLTWTTAVLGLSGPRPSSTASLLQTSGSSSAGGLGEGAAALQAGERPDELGLADWPRRSRRRDEGAKKNVVQMLNYGDVQYVTYLSVGGQTICHRRSRHGLLRAGGVLAPLRLVRSGGQVRPAAELQLHVG